jgi:hypothetical protein
MQKMRLDEMRWNRITSLLLLLGSSQLWGYGSDGLKCDAVSSHRILTTQEMRKRILKKVPIQQPGKGTFRGKTKLLINVGKNGEVVCAEVLNGNPLMFDSVLSSVRKWRFSRYIDKSGKATPYSGELEIGSGSDLAPS